MPHASAGLGRAGCGPRPRRPAPHVAPAEERIEQVRLEQMLADGGTCRFARAAGCAPARRRPAGEQFEPVDRVGPAAVGAEVGGVIRRPGGEDRRRSFPPANGPRRTGPGGIDRPGQSRCCCGGPPSPAGDQTRRERDTAVGEPFVKAMVLVQLAVPGNGLIAAMSSTRIDAERIAFRPEAEAAEAVAGPFAFETRSA